jgi:hypothetical protein
VVSDSEVIDLSEFRETLKENEEQEGEMELCLPLSMIRDLILKGYDPTSLQDIEKYIFIHDAIDTMLLRYDKDG